MLLTTTGSFNRGVPSPCWWGAPECQQEDFYEVIQPVGYYECPSYMEDELIPMPCWHEDPQVPEEDRILGEDDADTVQDSEYHSHLVSISIVDHPRIQP